MMSCAEFLRIIGLYLDGELEARLHTEGEAHLAGCPACRAKMADWQTCLDWLRRSMPERPPPVGMWEEICVRLDER